MIDLIDRILDRDRVFEEETEAIFGDLIPTLEAIAKYMGIPFGLTEWNRISIENNNLIFIEMFAYVDVETGLKRIINIGIPIELMEHGEPEDIIEFLKDAEKLKKEEQAIADQDDALTQHLIEQTRGKIH